MEWDTLEQKGWQELPNVNSVSDLQRLATRLNLAPVGEPTELRPLSGDQAKGHSFSARCGTLSFPLHTDAAYWNLPPRYLLMWSVDSSPIPTLVLGAVERADYIPLELLARSIFSIKTVAGSLYGGLGLSEHHCGYLRYDPFRMKPENRYAVQLQSILHKPPMDLLCEVRWTGGMAVVIDNWRCLHGRSAVSFGHENRLIHRIYVGGRKQ